MLGLGLFAGAGGQLSNREVWIPGGAIPGDIILQNCDFDLPLGHFCRQQMFAAICSEVRHQATKQATPLSSSEAGEVEEWQTGVEDRASGEPGPCYLLPR